MHTWRKFLQRQKRNRQRLVACRLAMGTGSYRARGLKQIKLALGQDRVIRHDRAQRSMIVFAKVPLRKLNKPVSKGNEEYVIETMTLT